MNEQQADVTGSWLKSFGCITLILLAVGFFVYPLFTTRHPARKPSCLANMNQIAKAMLSYCGDYDDRFPCTRAPGAGRGLRPERGIEARTGAVPFGGTTWVEKIDPYLQRGSIIDGPRGEMSGVLNCPEWLKTRKDRDAVRDHHSYGYNFLFLGLPWDENNAPKTNPYRTWGFTSGAASYQLVDDISDTILLVESQSIWAFPPYTAGGRALAQNRACISPRHSGKVNVAFCDGHSQVLDATELVTNGRMARNGRTGRTPNNRLWDPTKSKYPEDTQKEE